MQHTRTKTVEDKRYANERIKQLQPKKPRAAKQPWKESTNHNYELETDLKPLKATALTNAENYRVHLLPRSYR